MNYLIAKKEKTLICFSFLFVPYALKFPHVVYDRKREKERATLPKDVIGFGNWNSPRLERVYV